MCRLFDGRFIAYVDVQMSPWVTWDMSLGGVFVGKFGGKKGENTKKQVGKGDFTGRESQSFQVCLICILYTLFFVQLLTCKNRTPTPKQWELCLVLRHKKMGIRGHLHSMSSETKATLIWAIEIPSQRVFWGEGNMCLIQKSVQNREKQKVPKKRNKTIFLNNIFIFLHNLETLQRKKQKNSFPEKKLDLKQPQRWGDFVSVCLSCQLEMAMGGFSVVTTWGLKSSQHPRCL